MSKSGIEKNWAEIHKIVVEFTGRQFMLEGAIVQLIEREKIMVVNRYRKNHGEPLIPTDPPKYPGGHDFEWIIPVPQEWYSLTGKEAP